MNKKTEFQKGNQYARKHGFYSPVLDETEKLDYEQAICVEGLDNEIALLRVKLKSLIARDPENIKLITQATNALVRMVIAKCNISKDDKVGVKAAVDNVMKDIVFPFGFNKNQVTVGFKK